MPAAIPASAVPSARAVAYVLLGLALFAGCFSFCRKDWTELPLYLRAAERLRQGDPLYRHDERPWTYPALFALPFIPLLELPAPLRAPLWHALNCAVVLVLVWRLERRVLPFLGAKVWLFWALLLLLAGRHVLSPLENQSHDLLVFLCVVLALEARCAERGALAGWWAGLGAALKATPLLLLPMFLWQRRFRAAAVMVAVIPPLLLLPDVLCPARDGTSWTVAWHREFLSGVKPGETAVSSAWDPWCQHNQSLAGTLQRLLVPLPPNRGPQFDHIDASLTSAGPRAVRAATLAAQLAVFLWLLWLARPAALAGLSGPRREWALFGQGAAVVTGMVLLSPTSIKTHFCVLLLPLAFCLAHYLYEKRGLVQGAALLLAFVLGSLTAKGLLGKDLGDRVMASGSVTWCAVALLLATGHALAYRPTPRNSALPAPLPLLHKPRRRAERTAGTSPAARWGAFQVGRRSEE